MSPTARRGWVVLGLLMLVSAAQQFHRNSLPAVADQVMKDCSISEQSMGALYWFFFASYTCLMIPGGWLADRWTRRNVRGRIFASAVGMALIVPAIFGVGNAGTLAVAIGFLVLFGLGWGFFDCNNMPILRQIVRPELAATGYGVMNLVSISCGGFADWGFGALRDRHVPLFIIFSIFASVAVLSIALVLLIKPSKQITDRN